MTCSLSSDKETHRIKRNRAPFLPSDTLPGKCLCMLHIDLNDVKSGIRYDPEIHPLRLLCLQWPMTALGENILYFAIMPVCIRNSDPSRNSFCIHLLTRHGLLCGYVARCLECSSATGLITFHWIKGRMSPMPDFSTLVSAARWKMRLRLNSLQHSCHDLEQVLNWTMPNEVYITGEILKDDGVRELEELFWRMDEV
jgi:hypothetical protein